MPCSELQSYPWPAHPRMDERRGVERAPAPPRGLFGRSNVDGLCRSRRDPARRSTRCNLAELPVVGIFRPLGSTGISAPGGQRRTLLRIDDPQVGPHRTRQDPASAREGRHEMLHLAAPLLLSVRSRPPRRGAPAPAALTMAWRWPPAGKKLDHAFAGRDPGDRCDPRGKDRAALRAFRDGPD